MSSTLHKNTRYTTSSGTAIASSYVACSGTRSYIVNVDKIVPIEDNYTQNQSTQETSTKADQLSKIKIKFDEISLNSGAPSCSMPSNMYLPLD